MRATNGYVYPASHRAGSNSSALPMGARLRLKATKDLSGYPPPVRRIFEAMKTYGLIVADNGSDMYVTGTYDPRWDMDPFVSAFRTLTANDFEVVQLGWQPPAPPTPPTGDADADGLPDAWEAAAGSERVERDGTTPGRTATPTVTASPIAQEVRGATPIRSAPLSATSPKA